MIYREKWAFDEIGHLQAYVNVYCSVYHTGADVHMVFFRKREDTTAINHLNYILKHGIPNTEAQVSAVVEGLFDEIC